MSSLDSPLRAVPDETFGEHVRRVRSGKSMTQASAALKIKVSQQKVADWEAERRLPTPSDLPLLAVFLEVPDEELAKEIEQAAKRRSNKPTPRTKPGSPIEEMANLLAVYRERVTSGVPLTAEDAAVLQTLITTLAGLEHPQR